MIGLALLYLAIIIAQILAIQGITDYQADNIASKGRIGGLGAAGEYSIMLSLFFPFSLSAAFFMKKISLSKFFFSLLSICMLIGYAYAGSRNGILTLVSATLLYFILINRFILIKVYWITVYVPRSTTYICGSHIVSHIVARILSLKYCHIKHNLAGALPV